MHSKIIENDNNFELMESCSESSCLDFNGDGLLTLPILNLDQISIHLSFSDILTLRLVCKWTKEWVESRFPDDFRVSVTSRKTFTSLINSTNGNWSNFYFHWYINPPTKSFSSFLSQYSYGIRILHFSSECFDSSVIKIVSNCCNLRTLIIEEISAYHLSELSQSVKDKFAQGCSKLENLAIHSFLGLERSGLSFFTDDVLGACSSTLRSFVVPYISFRHLYPYSFKIEDKNSKDLSTPTELFVVRPILQLLENRCISPNLENIVVTPSSRSALSDSFLFCLTLLCYKRRINLIYDKYTEAVFLKLGKLRYPLTPENGMQMSEIASKIMTVMASTTDLLLNYEFANLRKLVVQFTTFHIDQDIFVVQNFPRLHTLYIDFKIRKGETSRHSRLKRMDMFVQGLLEVRRPSVKTLHLYHHSVVANVISFNMDKVVNSFYNLTVLCITSYSGKGEDFVKIWKGLRLLQEVEIQSCKDCNDQAILGKDWIKPAILELTDLRILRLQGVGRITDLSYIIAFARLRLTVFYHVPRFSSDVTFEGYNALGEGDFAKTIRFLGGSTTQYGRHTKPELKQYLDNFASLLTSEKKRIVRNFSKWRRLSKRCIAKM